MVVRIRTVSFARGPLRMDETLYTIESDSGTYLAQDPSAPDRKMATLYHDPELAAKVAEQAGESVEWRVVPVTDLESWLDKLLADDVTHVCEHFAAVHSTERTTAGWLLMIRAKQAGQEYRRRQ